MRDGPFGALKAFNGRRSDIAPTQVPLMTGYGRERERAREGGRVGKEDG